MNVAAAIIPTCGLLFNLSLVHVLAHSQRFYAVQNMMCINLFVTKALYSLGQAGLIHCKFDGYVMHITSCVAQFTTSFLTIFPASPVSLPGSSWLALIWMLGLIQSAIPLLHMEHPWSYFDAACEPTLENELKLQLLVDLVFVLLGCLITWIGYPVVLYKQSQRPEPNRAPASASTYLFCSVDTLFSATILVLNLALIAFHQHLAITISISRVIKDVQAISTPLLFLTMHARLRRVYISTYWHSSKQQTPYQPVVQTTAEMSPTEVITVQRQVQYHSNPELFNAPKKRQTSQGP